MVGFYFRSLRFWLIPKEIIGKRGENKKAEISYKNSRLGAKGACNQGKEVLEQNPCSRGNSAPRLLLERIFRNARLRVSQETGKKKAPVIGFLVPFYVKHSKDLCQRCVTRANKNFIPQWWLLSKSFYSMPRYDLALRYALLSSTMYCVNCS